MKAEAELNALLLQAKLYERLDGIIVEIVEDDGFDAIEVDHLPKSMVEYFKNRIKGIIAEEKLKALELVEQAAENYAKAAIK